MVCAIFSITRGANLARKPKLLGCAFPPSAIAAYLPSMQEYCGGVDSFRELNKQALWIGGRRIINKKVVVYSTPTCPYCKMAKDYLSRKGISYVDHNVAQDKDKTKEMIEKSGQIAVPVITIDDDIVIGFKQALLDKLLSQ